jgi:hypothetical protein
LKAAFLIIMITRTLVWYFIKHYKGYLLSLAFYVVVIIWFVQRWHQNSVTFVNKRFTCFFSLRLSLIRL